MLGFHVKDNFIMKTIHEKHDPNFQAKGRCLIDAHHHLWNLDHNHYPWLANMEQGTFMGDYSSIQKNYLPENYLHDSRHYRVLATVHCEADHDYTDEVRETQWVHEQAATYGFPNAVLPHVWFHLPSCEEIIQQHLAYPLVRGIRSKPVTAKSPELAHTVNGTVCSMQDDNWLKGFSLLEKYNLSWDLRVPYWHLKEAAEVANMFPNTKIVLNHTGFPWDRSKDGISAWYEGMEVLADCPNVWVKISELRALNQEWSVANNREVVQKTAKLFGIGRSMFASNFPVASLKVSYDDQVEGMVMMLDNYNDNELGDFFWRNAKEFYRLQLD